MEPTETTQDLYVGTALVPPTPIIEVPEGVGPGYTPLQAAMIYLVSMKRVRSATSTMLAFGLVLMLLGGSLLIWLYSTVISAIRFSKMTGVFSPIAYAMLISPGLIVLGGLVLCGLPLYLRKGPLAISMRLLDGLTFISLIFYCAFLPVSLGKDIIEVLTSGTVQWSDLPTVLVYSAIIVYLVLLSPALVKQAYQYLRHSRRYGPALATPPSEDVKEEAADLLLRMMTTAAADDPDVLVFRVGTSNGRALLHEDLLILALGWGKSVQHLFFLSPGSRFIEVKGGQPPRRKQHATFYLEDMKLKGSIEPAMLRRYEEWGARETAELRPPG